MPTGSRSGPPGRPRRTAPLDLDAERAGEQRVVAELRMRVEREVVRGEVQVGGEERLEPAALAPVDQSGSFRQNIPWWTITSCAPARRSSLEQVERGGDTARDLATSSAPTTWSPGVPYSGKRWTSSSSFAYAMISSRWATGRLSLPFARSGCGAAW